MKLLIESGKTGNHGNSEMTEPFQGVSVPVEAQVPLPMVIIDAGNVLGLHSLYNISPCEIVALYYWLVFNY